MNTRRLREPVGGGTTARAALLVALVASLGALAASPLARAAPANAVPPGAAAPGAPSAAVDGAANPPSAAKPHDPQARPPITGRLGVVTSLHPLSSMAGMRLLLAGGNAFDAAIAAAIATTVVDPKDSTLGGQGFATVYVARERAVRALNFYGVAPRAATVERLAGKPYKMGYLSTPVPSNLKGYEALHRRHGSRPWAEVLQPAIELAEQGFLVTDEFVGILGVHEKELRQFPSTARVFFPEGRMPRVGEVFRQPDLARTLKRIAAEGADVFYKGEIARGIARFYADNGGILAYEDLANYEASWVEPISVDYRGYQVYTQPPNSSGIAVLMQLRLLEGFDLKALGHNTPAYLHVIGEVQRLAIADRNRYVADPEFVSIPLSRLLSREYAAERRKLVSMDSTLPVVPPPVEADAGGKPRRGAVLRAPRGAKPDKANTTHLTVVDAAGNMVALTQTLGAWYGSGVVAADTGVLFSNQLRHLHTEADSPSKLAPGRRPRSNQSPLIVLKDGQPWLAIGTPGSDGIWQRLAQVMANIVDFGMDVQSAVAAPRMIYGGYQETGTQVPPKFDIEDRIAPETVAALRAQGYELDVIPSDEGSVNGVMRDLASGFMTGGADPRRLGTEDGWWGPVASVYAIGW
ncbi:MAG: gamma-glutamyltransferase [Steroidobacteraceae bacterium]|mgnify:CR=1 FL=1